MEGDIISDFEKKKRKKSFHIPLLVDIQNVYPYSDLCAVFDYSLSVSDARWSVVSPCSFSDTWCRQWGVVGMRSWATASDMCGASLGKTNHSWVNRGHQSRSYVLADGWKRNSDRVKAADSAFVNNPPGMKSWSHYGTNQLMSPI